MLDIIIIIYSSVFVKSDLDIFCFIHNFQTFIFKQKDRLCHCPSFHFLLFICLSLPLSSTRFFFDTLFCSLFSFILNSVTVSFAVDHDRSSVNVKSIITFRMSGIYIPYPNCKVCEVPCSIRSQRHDRANDQSERSRCVCQLSIVSHPVTTPLCHAS